MVIDAFSFSLGVWVCFVTYKATQHVIAPYTFDLAVWLVIRWYQLRGIPDEQLALSFLRGFKSGAVRHYALNRMGVLHGFGPFLLSYLESTIWPVALQKGIISSDVQKACDVIVAACKAED